MIQDHYQADRQNDQLDGLVGHGKQFAGEHIPLPLARQPDAVPPKRGAGDLYQSVDNHDDADDKNHVVQDGEKGKGIAMEGQVDPHEEENQGARSSYRIEEVVVVRGRRS